MSFRLIFTDCGSVFFIFYHRNVLCLSKIAISKARQYNECWLARCAMFKVRKRAKIKESMQSSTTPDQGYKWESDNNFTIRHHKREQNLTFTDLNRRDSYHNLSSSNVYASIT